MHPESLLSIEVFDSSSLDLIAITIETVAIFWFLLFHLNTPLIGERFLDDSSIEWLHSYSHQSKINGIE